jgi:glycosyltransferase involved in cell wall biosynthesis/predicted SAM-dependent methyltransferase
MRPALAPRPSDEVAAIPAPTFTVVVAAYNAAASVAAAVESALAQTLPPHEVIVVDDGSTDGTEDTLLPYRDGITYIRQENRGAAAASNAGFRGASGDFVVILDADDVYAPERLEALAELASGRPDLDILSTDAYLEADGEIVERFFERTPFAISDQRLAILERCFLACPAVRRETILSVGGFDESLRIGYDWECWIRLFHLGALAGAVDEPLLHYRLGAGSLTGNRVAAVRSRVRVLELASRLDLSSEERFALERYLRRRRSRALLADAEQALRGHADDARRLALQVAGGDGLPVALRLKALAAAAAPGLAGARLEAIEERTGQSRIRRGIPGTGKSSQSTAAAASSPAEKPRYPYRRRASELGRRISDRREYARYLAAHSIRKLQIGAGPNPLPGWLNTDLHPDIYPDRRDEIFFLDATRRFPIPDASFDYVFSEHQIEHVAEKEARQMLRECFRVVVPGGRIRIATPDLAAIVALYEEPFDPVKQHYVTWVSTKLDAQLRTEAARCYVVNQMFTAYGHRFVYDEAALRALLEDAGFTDVTRHAPGESEDPELMGLEAHGRAIGDEAVNRFETMALEARRP